MQTAGIIARVAIGTALLVSVPMFRAQSSTDNASSEKHQPNVTEGKLLQRVEPIYPPIAQAARVQGIVVLKAVIGKDGLLNSVTVVGGPPMLQQAAIDRVKQWKYQLYLLDGEPVEVETTLNIAFSLEDRAPSHQNQLSAKARAEATASARREARREGILVDSPARASARRQYASFLQSSMRPTNRSNPGDAASHYELRVYTLTPNPKTPLPPEVVRQDYRLTLESNGTTLPHDITELLKIPILNSFVQKLGFTEMSIQDSIGVHRGTTLCTISFQKNGAHPVNCMRDDGVDIVHWDVFHEWPRDYVIHDVPLLHRGSSEDSSVPAKAKTSFRPHLMISSKFGQ